MSVTVENCWDTWAENIRYDVSVAVGGNKVFDEEAVDHRRLSRWRMVFFWPKGAGDPVHVAHDFVYLSCFRERYRDSGTLSPAQRHLPPTWFTVT